MAEYIQSEIKVVKSGDKIDLPKFNISKSDRVFAEFLEEFYEGDRDIVRWLKEKDNVK